MFFSVLMPVYNVEKYIRQSIDSVLSQDEQDFELILCDDGSTDSSGQICDEYAAKHLGKIRVIHKKNEGLLLTRRRMIKEARGDWFVHLDSDDYMMPGALQSIRKTAEENDADLVIGTYVRGKESPEDLSDIANLPFEDEEIFAGESKHKLLMQFLYGGSVTAIWQKVAKRTIVDVEADYDDVNFVSMMEDHLQSMPLLDASHKAIYINKPFIYYRYNENSITKKKGFESYKKGFESMRTVYQREIVYREKWPISSDENAKILSKHFRKLCAPLADAVSISTVQERSNFIAGIVHDIDLKSDYKSADKKVMGRRSRILFWLAFHNMNYLLRKLCKM